MIDVKVVVVYTNELISIFVDDIDMDIDPIKEKPIKNWFSVSDGRDGWKGLIEKIWEYKGDKNVILNFGFSGPEKEKHIFEECINNIDISTNKILPSKEIEEKIIENAEKASHKKLYTRALSYYINAADYENSIKAQYSVAQYYFKYHKGTIELTNINKETSITSAINYYEKAAKQGHTESKYCLYQIFSTGDGISKDLKKAIEWLSDIANNGDAKAQYKLGLYYQEGKGISKNDTEAVKWFQKAVEQNIPEAQCHLGHL